MSTLWQYLSSCDWSSCVQNASLQMYMYIILLNTHACIYSVWDPSCKFFIEKHYFAPYTCIYVTCINYVIYQMWLRNNFFPQIGDHTDCLGEKIYIINMCLKIFFLLFIGFGNHLSQYWRKVKTKHFVIWKFSWLITFLYSNSVVIYPGVGRVVKATAVWRTRRACHTPIESPSGTCGTFGQWIFILFLSLYYV